MAALQSAGLSMSSSRGSTAEQYAAFCQATTRGVGVAVESRRGGTELYSSAPPSHLQYCNQPPPLHPTHQKKGSGSTQHASPESSLQQHQAFQNLALARDLNSAALVEFLQPRRILTPSFFRIGIENLLLYGLLEQNILVPSAESDRIDEVMSILNHGL